MLRYIFRRLLLLVPVLLGVTLLVFLIFHLTPSDPARVLLSEMGQGASPEAIASLRHQLGLDRPWYIQYGDFVWRALQGDLGRSFRGDRPVLLAIQERFPTTLTLTLTSLGVAALMGIPAGVVAAVRRNTWWDHAIMVVALIGVSLPSFWFGIMLMHLFALHWKWLPPSGTGTWQHMILPTVTVVLSSVAFITRMTRSAMLDQLREDYVRTARSKGLEEAAVIFVHTLRNAFVPILTTLGLQFGNLLGGVAVIESVFSLPGLGRLAVESIKARDLPSIQGSVLWVAILFSLTNLLVDLGYAALDPRIRYE